MKKLIIAFIILMMATGAVYILGGSAHASTLSGPAMGYNTWYQYDSEINEEEVLAQANHMVNDGLVAAGYNTMTLDDGWQGTPAATRTATTPITWNTNEFPHGIPWLVQQLTAMGMKLGIYTAIGTYTCAANHVQAGSYGHYAQDAATFKSWGASFVKVDQCGGVPNGENMTTLFEEMGTAVHADGMTYDEEQPAIPAVGTPAWSSAVQTAAQIADAWRMTPDEHVSDGPVFTVIGHLNSDIHLHNYARPGHWNDLDMLLPGVPTTHPFNWSQTSSRSQLSVWAQEASPLFISTNMATLPAGEVNDLKNPYILAIDQSGSQAARGLYVNGVQMLAKPAAGGTSVLFANMGNRQLTTVWSLAQLGISHRITASDVWSGRNWAVAATIAVPLAPGATELLVLK
jgi:alpha-galactosidase